MSHNGKEVDDLTGNAARLDLSQWIGSKKPYPDYPPPELRAYVDLQGMIPAQYTPPASITRSIGNSKSY